MFQPKTHQAHLVWFLARNFVPAAAEANLQAEASTGVRTDGVHSSSCFASRNWTELNGYNKQPVCLLVFIGTADDKCLRPHPFYQVHMVTGKTVTTMCQEKMMYGTKVLEVPLLPESDMSASIDCAGILKLRNADIELKKGETNIGRKNTRVQFVFRVALPQQDGQMLWLQTASIPVECSQRSGQELPQVESFSPACCFVDGGEELLITGSNMSAESRVVFIEKGPDGRLRWEVDARVLSNKSNDFRIVVEVPPYIKRTTSPLQVQFYVSNGKRRRSLMQSFTYLPVIRDRHDAASANKQEHWGSELIFCPEPSLSPSHGAMLKPDVAYEPCHFPLHGPSSRNFSHLQDPPAFTPSLQSSLFFPYVSSVPCQTMSPLPNQGLMSAQIGTIEAQASSPPIKISNTPYQASDGVLPRKQFGNPKNTLRSSVDSHIELLHNSGEVPSVEQEPEEQPILGSLGFQEITLEDAVLLTSDYKPGSQPAIQVDFEYQQVYVSHLGPWPAWHAWDFQSHRYTVPPID
ncbi:hypothetical protein GOODEAATRI_010916 [Goodea atripinnis]|uniref:RHD domain-containing protein n=1 Tax=Goodea atripinnis TaxID=208336 RepID=A0ABV0NJ87_9TELE